MNASELKIQDDLNVYPNPASNYIIVQCKGQEFIECYDLQGKLILKNKIESPRTQIDVSNLSKGIYIIKVGEKSKKWIKN